MGTPGPKGILMTDLEGSTAHLRTLGDRYGEVLARHHDIIQRAIAAEGGAEVGGEGDSFAAVFDRSASALRAAVAAQRMLAAEVWPDGPWRVRMGVHAGEVDQSDAGAVGIALHEAARVRSVAHGGQIVVSDQAHRAIDEAVPADVRLLDLGTHAVRDFATPIRLYQVRAPGLEADFPALHTLPASRVPAPASTFVERSEEVEGLTADLGRSRLVTVTGAGGSGKTRLALEVARTWDRESVVVVELAGLREPSQVPAEVATQVGARGTDAIVETLGSRDVLLVLDNCEHLVESVAGLVSELLAGCAALRILATSREPLGVTGESVRPVPAMTPHQAVQLLEARASTPIDPAVASDICARLGWMPLAIELAAARLRSIPADALAARLDDQLSILTTGTRDVPRHRTLRATIDWSYGLLEPGEQALLRRLGVFAGGFGLEAAEAVTGGGGSIIDALDGLVSKSMVEMRTREGGRYQMLEPIRQYAVEQLVAAGESDTTREAHAGWATRVARDANRGLFRDQRRWNAVLEAERDNLGAAIGWSLEHDRLPLAAALVGNLAWYWFTEGRNDAFVWIPRALDHVDQFDRRDRAVVLLAAGITWCDVMSDDRPYVWLAEAADLFRELDAPRPLGSALFWLGRAAVSRNDLDAAQRAFEEAIGLQEGLGDKFGWGWTLIWLGILARLRGDVDRAEAICEDVLARCEDVPHVVAAAWGELAHVVDDRDDPVQAEQCARRAIELYRDLGDSWQVAMAVGSWGYYLARLGRLDEAASATLEALVSIRALRADPNLVHALHDAAWLLQQAGEPERCAVLLGAVEPETRAVPVYWRTSHYLSLEPMLTDPAHAQAIERGRHLTKGEAAEMAQTWLVEQYAGSSRPEG